MGLSSDRAPTSVGVAHNPFVDATPHGNKVGGYPMHPGTPQRINPYGIRRSPQSSATGQGRFPS